MNSLLENFKKWLDENESSFPFGDRRRLRGHIGNPDIIEFDHSICSTKHPAGHTKVELMYKTRHARHIDSYYIDDTTYHREHDERIVDMLSNVGFRDRINALNPDRLLRNLQHVVGTDDGCENCVMNYQLNKGKLTYIRLSRDKGMMAVEYPVKN